MIKSAFWKGFAKGVKSLPKHVQEDLAKQHAREGVGFFTGPAMYLAGKAGKKRKAIAIMKSIQKPALDTDTALGHYADKAMQKSPIGKRLFKLEEHIKTGPKSYEKFDRPSITAPLSKATEIAKPVVFGLSMDKVVRDHKKVKNEQH